MDFSAWGKVALLTGTTASLCHLTILQLRLGGALAIDCTMITGCWLLVCYIIHSEGKLEQSDVLVSKQTTSHMAGFANQEPTQIKQERENEGIFSKCQIGVKSQEQPNSFPPTTPPTKFPDFFEPDVESNMSQLSRLRSSKEELTTELAESFLVVEFQSEMKRAAMEFYFAHLRTDRICGSDKHVGEAAYLKARDLFRDIIRLHKGKEDVIKELAIEIEGVEERLRQEAEKEREERRGSGETLVENCDLYQV
ncbi:hypothetical protein ONS95_008523 [Cadophora gregata]|uniref:uncharacterized protein n=1 Tax=Cadophora gregata TaxID=51156 RepID=UPI0026DBEFAC|nr:uncharacterized protein ONS95_008523 [Cadophora gregata]KAK0100185.1 hypothetical protein ONS95_008523 [Cadophora gregata]KAK0114868.1 hypothetical protein ONS96_013348 [Cadophora gregata f. sp. sojae]